MAGTTVSTSKNINENGNGLILYHYYCSFYSRKVVFALLEKKLKFKSHIVNLMQGEQFQPWFIKLNPKCEVPVLKDGVKIIPDSQRIIEYLEDNFSNGNTPRLIPEKGSPQFQLMERMRDLLDNVPISIITFGCINNLHLTGPMRMNADELRERQGVLDNHKIVLNDLCEKYAEYKDLYMQKILRKSNLCNLFSDISEVEKALHDLEYALIEVEKILSSHNDEDKKDWWLCSNAFTIADISLSIILHRMYDLGLDHRFFKDNSFPCVQAYYHRVQQRDSFRKTIFQGSGVMKAFTQLDTRDQVITVGGVAAVLCAAGVAALLLINRHK